MSMLVFTEESRWVSPGAADYFATVAGAAMPESSYDEFSRRLGRLKQKFFKKQKTTIWRISDQGLRGRALLNPRSWSTSFRKVEFIGELVSLCRLHQVVVFSSTKKFFSREQIPDPDTLPLTFPAGAISRSDQSSEEALSLLLAYLLEVVNSYMLENHPGQLAKLIFKTEEAHQDDRLCASVMNFLYRTPFGGGFRGLLGAPLFMPLGLSPGLQVADVFAYLINQHHAGRRDIAELYAEVESMQFVSAVEKDEYGMRGMNLLE